MEEVIIETVDSPVKAALAELIRLAANLYADGDKAGITLIIHGGRCEVLVDGRIVDTNGGIEL